MGNNSKHTVYIALGSNLGDRIAMIEKACMMLDEDPSISVTRTSSLYETEPMYVKEQSKFLNGVCEIVTTLDPIDLLDRLQHIENTMGRIKHINKGPRNIDLDILLFDDQTVQEDRLSIPHMLMLERGFVLRPLCDIIPYHHIPNDASKKPFLDHLLSLPSPLQSITSTTPLANDLSILPLQPTRRTKLMSILNLTPDSFSDGGMHERTDLNTLSNTIQSHISNGTTIVDVGGQSSRPNAPDVSAEEEVSRVLPTVKLMVEYRSRHPNQPFAISVDTYRATVAAAAVDAGADIVNDISAGLLDPSMLTTCAKLGCTVVLMHMRGTPSTMTSEENTYYPNDLIRTIAAELKERIAEAESAGIRRWKIILDPGIGFAKTAAQNIEILQRFNELKSMDGLQGLPWVVGSSRKGFIGKITGVQDPAQRLFGTAATVAAAIQGGADCVRVHDVAEMAQVIKMSDAIWRR